MGAAEASIIDLELESPVYPNKETFFGLCAKIFIYAQADKTSQFYRTFSAVEKIRTGIPRGPLKSFPAALSCDPIKRRGEIVGYATCYVACLSGLHPQRYHETLGKRVGLGGSSGDFPMPTEVLGTLKN